MAVWVVVLALLADLAPGAARVMVGSADAALLAALLAHELVLVTRRRRAAAALPRAERGLPGWVSSPLLARPTPEQLRRCAGLATTSGAGSGHDEHVNSRHVA